MTTERTFTTSQALTRDPQPFRRKGLIRRLGPFAVVAVLAEASLALPPGPTSTRYTVTSILLLIASASCIFLPWDRLPRWVDVVVPLLYVGSVLTLVLAAGGSNTGVGTVILIPLVWTALNHRPSQSVIITLAVVAYETISSLTPIRVSDAVLARRVFIWLALASFISFATHELRLRVAEALEQRRILIEEREQSLEEMTSSINELEQRHRESRLLRELGDVLQACVNLEEVYNMVSHSSGQLFPSGGVLSTYNSSRNLLETAATWGPRPVTREVFAPYDCWALRRGRLHVSDQDGVTCAHLRDWGASAALCIPMVAQGETIGVFHMFSKGIKSADLVSARSGGSGTMRELVLAVGEHVGMSIANFRLRETLRNQSIHDPLTNLYNRRYMEETLTRELARASRDHDEISIVQIDVDHFKDFNDAYGHDVGDNVLRSLGELFLSYFRDFDVPCRYGGEEFTLILPNSTLEQTEERVVELQRRVAEIRLSRSDHEKTLLRPPTLSIGLASFPQNGRTSDVLVRAADQALYAAKSAGRDTIVRAPLESTLRRLAAE